MQVWLETSHERLLQCITRTLKAGIAHNCGTLPPFRLPAKARQISAGLLEFGRSGDGSAVGELGRQLGKEGLGLRSALALAKELPAEFIVADAAPAVLVARSAVLQSFLVALVDGVATSQEQILIAQRDEIQLALARMVAEREAALERTIVALSTPIIPIFENVLVLPLIGELDRARIGRMREQLLDEVVKRQAAVVILDVTGVPAADVGTADVLRTITRSTKLIGAICLVVGISPQLATFMVKSGEDLRELDVHADLQRGLEHALRLKGLGIQGLRPESPRAPALNRSQTRRP